MTVYTSQSSGYSLDGVMANPISVLPYALKGSYTNMVDKKLVLKFDGALTAVGSDQDRFKIALLKLFSEKYPQHLWENAQLRSGSIFADISIRGTESELNGTLAKLMEDGKSGVPVQVDGKGFYMLPYVQLEDVVNEVEKEKEEPPRVWLYIAIAFVVLFACVGLCIIGFYIAYRNKKNTKVVVSVLI